MRDPKITIFNGRRRTLGDEGRSEVYIQMYVSLREDLKLFSLSEWMVLCAIAFSIDEQGWAYPKVATLARRCNLHRDTVRKALNGLCKLRVDGQRVLLKYQPRRRDLGQLMSKNGRGGDGCFESNRYLVFPSVAEIRRYEGSGVQHLGARTGGGFVKSEPSLEKPSSVQPSTVEPSSVRPMTKDNHVKNNHHGSDGVLDLLVEFGVRRTKKVRGLVARYNVEEVQRMITVAEGSGLENPQGFVVSMMVNGDVPPTVTENEELDYCTKYASSMPAWQVQELAEIGDGNE